MATSICFFTLYISCGTTNTKTLRLPKSIKKGHTCHQTHEKHYPPPRQSGKNKSSLPDIKSPLTSAVTSTRRYDIDLSIVIQRTDKYERGIRAM